MVTGRQPVMRHLAGLNAQCGSAPQPFTSNDQNLWMSLGEGA
jgi:hypothetical protein